MASSIEARDISRRRGAGAQLRREEDPANRPITGGDTLVKTLLDHGVDTAFGVPGESYPRRPRSAAGGAGSAPLRRHPP